MADPLSTLVDREAPAPTNYFNPAASQGLMSRYASARRGVASSEILARSSERLAQGRLAQGRVQAKNVAEDDIQAARRRIMDTREDDEYQAKKDADSAATEVLKTIDTVFDPSKPEEFDMQLADFVKSAPASVMDDPRVSTYLKVKTAIADDNRAKANAEARYKASRENTLAILGYKDLMGATRAGVTPDAIDATINPETGEPDFAKVNQLRGEIERKTKDDEFTRREKLRQDNRLAILDARDLSKTGRTRQAAIQKFIIEDTTAFPSRVAALIAATGGKKTLDLLKLDPKTAAEATAAEQWDKNKLQKELSAAYAYNDPDDYVNLIDDLSESQKERRRQVWDNAHKDGAVEEIDDAPAAPEGTVEDYVPPQTTPLPKDKWEVGKKYTMNDGSVRIYKGDGKFGE